MAFLGPRRSRREAAAPRRLGCFWPLFWLLLLIVVLGLMLGGYRKGTKVGAPLPPVATSARQPVSSSLSAHGSAASHNFAN